MVMLVGRSPGGDATVEEPLEVRRLGGVGPVGAVGAKRARNTSGSKAGARRAALGAAAHGGEPLWTMWNRSGAAGAGPCGTRTPYSGRPDTDRQTTPSSPTGL